MRLLDLIDYLVHPDQLVKLYRRHCIAEDAEEEGFVAIYMAGTRRLASAVRLFTDEQTGGRLRFHHDGIEYVCVLDVDTAVDLLASDPDVQGPDVTHLTRANRLLQYSMYDA